MLEDFFRSLHCVRPEEDPDFRSTLRTWKDKSYHTALCPAITWYGGTCDLFDRKGGSAGKNMIWLVPAGQSDFYWLPMLKRDIEGFYETDEIHIGDSSYFPGAEAEELEECILLHSPDLQNEPERTVLGANVLLIRLSLSGGSDVLLFLLLDHQDRCWKRIMEGYRIPLTWFVDSGRGTEDYFTRVNLYQLMKHTEHPELLPALYFKGLYNKGEIPEGFRFRYAMLSQPDANGYDKWQTFSAVYDAVW